MGRTRERTVGRTVARTAITLTCLGAVVAAVALGAAPLLERLGLSGTILPWGAECSVRDGDASIDLSLDQARRATTAIARDTSGTGSAAPEIDDIDSRALDLLREGPPDAPGPSLTCSVAGPEGDLPVEDMGESGLTPRARTVLDELTDVFGDLSVGGFEPGGIDEGHGEDSAHYEGRAVDVFFRPVSEENRRAGWILTNWLVAHADDLDVDVIIFDDQIFSARLPQWRDYNVADPDNEILRHLDHVHVDVRRGG